MHVPSDNKIDDVISHLIGMNVGSTTPDLPESDSSFEELIERMIVDGTQYRRELFENAYTGSYRGYRFCISKSVTSVGNPNGEQSVKAYYTLLVDSKPKHIDSLDIMSGLFINSVQNPNIQSMLSTLHTVAQNCHVRSEINNLLNISK